MEAYVSDPPLYVLPDQVLFEYRPGYAAQQVQTVTLSTRHIQPVLFKIKVKQFRVDKYHINPIMGIVYETEPMTITVKLLSNYNEVDIEAVNRSDRMLIEQCFISANEALARPAALWEKIKRRPDRMIYQQKIPMKFVRSRQTGPTNYLYNSNPDPRRFSAESRSPALRSPAVDNRPVRGPSAISFIDSPQAVSSPSLVRDNYGIATEFRFNENLMRPHSAGASGSAEPWRGHHERMSEGSIRPPLSLRSLPGAELVVPYTLVESTNGETSPSEEYYGRWTMFFASPRRLSGQFRKRGRAPYACGGYSDIWICDIKYVDGLMERVAVKELRAVNHNNGSAADNARMLTRLKREIVIWMNLDHPNIVPFLGFTFDPTFCLISPWYPNGNIRHHLREHPDHDRLSLMYEVACAIEHLHSRNPPIIHGDIKSDNVLITQDGHAVITDFGLSTILEDNPDMSSSLRTAGTLRWMAPELVVQENCIRSLATDVYSFGCVTLETFTGALPFDNLKRDVDIMSAILRNQPPISNRTQYPVLAGLIGDLVYDCWSTNPAQRPRMKMLQATLAHLQQGSRGTSAVGTSGHDAASISTGR
ncbi:Receptor-interacting serine/threonine-protein kinase 2 [Tulasnella sp. 403]|nr:Receptor-interacting serine/threonine-protein kinase 2 [Tulasnella sp. 403]